MKNRGKKVRKWSGSIVLAGAMVMSLSQTSFAQTQQNTSAPLVGATPLAAQHGTLLGQKGPNDLIQFSISLQLRNTSQLDSFIQSLYNPSSPNYKHFLTPAQFAASYGPSTGQVSQVQSFAEANGLQVVHTSAEGNLVHVSGTVKQIEQVFRVKINNYKNQKGQVYFANDVAPSVPSTLQGIILGIQGLDNEPHWHQTATRIRTVGQLTKGKAAIQTPNLGSGPAGGYTPTELKDAYGVTPLAASNITGSGQTIALFELDGYHASNISTYDSYYGLGSSAPSTVLVDGYNGAAGAGEGEVELDIEVDNAIAPAAHVNVYEGPNSDVGVIDTYQKIATDDTAKSISTSWGESELLSNPSTMSSMHNIFQQMAAQGQSIFSAAGDSGAYDGGSNAPSTLAVDSPANDPDVTGVGGTNLQLNSSGGYGSESTWSNTSNNSGGGGGLSTIYSQPSWQTGPGVQNSYSNGMREVPDVSADADPNSGYSIYSGGQWTVYGGTSCAAPLWAALTALNNQYAAANGKPALGYANPTLYKMFNTTQPYAAYQDVTTGNNLYYPATAGYDMATGIGTPNAYNLIRDINGASSGGGTTATQLIQNGGFESGSSPWGEYSSGGYELVSTQNPHTGSYSAWLGDYANADDSIQQTLSVPTTATAVTLSYWTNVQASAATNTDDLNVDILDSNGNLLQTLQTQTDETPTGWANQSFDLSKYAGQTIEVYFQGTNDSSNLTSFFVDDVSVTAK